MSINVLYILSKIYMRRPWDGMPLNEESCLAKNSFLQCPNCSIPFQLPAPHITAAIVISTIVSTECFFSVNTKVPYLFRKAN